jgi:alkylation response protein AidB-like acyl-CoA dehydrogenase
LVHDRLAERALLRESAERFVSRSYDIDGRNALVQGTPGFSTAHWATFAELGWLMIRIPEELGGIGAPFADAAVLLEAFGAGLLLEPFTSTVLLSGALLADGGASPVAAALLEALGEGGARVATAYRERDAGDVRAPATLITAHGDEFMLEGTKIAVPFAASADAFVVSARDDRGSLALVIAPRDRPGVSVMEDVAIDGSRSATVTFSGVHVARAARLPLDDPAAALERALDQADAALCAEAVGVMSRAYGDAAAHVRERLQFGRPIATFQTVRHRIADMYVERELARAAATLAADAIDRDGADRARCVSMAKLQVVRSGRFVCENAVQLHGAIGIAAEAAPAHALARITRIGATFGDIVFHRNRYLATREGTPL